MASSPSLEEGAPVTTSRYTNDGRKISYRLHVIQQPARARACGQGAKSSSDRRPVDPPPIISLHVLEGENDDDITFPYNAGFFLFATLEPARPIAHGRVAAAQANQPVLTGTPVAGIAYLDRPEPAGYFIFPDLSVRHEGQYRLSFTLFEELKEPRDADAERADENIGSSVHRRCEIKSAAFQVYSAKKFPGLAQSTLVSRVVADQGCRVRIRRDARVRRRESKHDKDWGDKDEEEPSAEGSANLGPSYDSKGMMSPTHSGEAPKDMDSGQSNSSTTTLQAPPPPPSNPSAPQQTSQLYPYQWYSRPQTGQQTPQHAVYNQQPPPEQSPAYPSQYQPQYSPTPQQGMTTQFSQYSPTYYSHSNPNQMVQSPTTYGYPMQQPAQPQQQPQQPLYHQHHQQQSMQYPTVYAPQDRDAYANQPYPPPHAANPPPDPNAPNPNVPLSHGKPLPPMEVPRVSHTTAEASRTGGATGPPTSSARPLPPQYLTSGSAVGMKRTYGQSFNTMPEEGSLRNGARPGGEEWSDQSEEDLQDLESIRMSYRRADGTYTMVNPRRFGVAG